MFLTFFLNVERTLGQCQLAKKGIVDNKRNHPVPCCRSNKAVICRFVILMSEHFHVNAHNLNTKANSIADH
jgi:hypothetical protein